MFIDSHAHLNFVVYKNNVDKIIQRSFDNQVWVINIGTNLETSKKAIQLAEKHLTGVYATIGLHPIHLQTDLVKIKNDSEEIEIKTKEENFNYQKYKELAQSSKKVIAIGEVGLDYYWRPKTKRKLELFKEKQLIELKESLKLARELNLPVILHCRMAHQDLIEILKFETQNSKINGVIHCFTGNLEQAQKYTEMGFYLGFNGLIFKLNADDVIKNIPLEKILIETDCPYLTPPQEENKQNEPIFIKHIAQKIANLKNISLKEVEQTTTQNTRRLFQI